MTGTPPDNLVRPARLADAALPPLPRHIAVTDSADGPTLVYRHLTWDSVAYFVAGVGVLVAVAVIFIGERWQGIWEKLAAAVPGVITVASLLAVILLLLLYCGAAMVLNRTYFEVCTADGGKRLVVRHRPLPWPGSLDVPATSLAAVTVTRMVDHENFPKVISALQVEEKDGEKLLLLGGMSAAEADACQAYLAEWLGLPTKQLITGPDADKYQAEAGRLP
jgi:hypothetical protein